MHTYYYFAVGALPRRIVNGFIYWSSEFPKYCYLSWITQVLLGAASGPHAGEGIALGRVGELGGDVGICA